MKDDQKFNTWYVKEIEKCPCLWNHNDPNYNIRQHQEEGWQSISESAGATVAECKERWKNLRASYTRHLKHQILEKRSGKRLRRPYYLAPHMNFLLPFAKAKSFPDDQEYYGDILKMHNEAENAENENETENVVYLDIDDEAQYREETQQDSEVDVLNEFLNMDKSLNVSKISKEIENIKVFNRYKRAAENETQDKDSKKHKYENDADMDFLKSLLPDFKAMNGNQKRKFKINVLKLMDEVLNSSDPSSSQIKT